MTANSRTPEGRRSGERCGGRVLRRDARPSSAASRRSVTLGIAALSWRGVEDGGLEVSGTITNATNASVRESTVGIVLRDAAGELLGGVYDIALGPLDAGESRVFVTDYPATPPIVAADVASAEAAAAGISE